MSTLADAYGAASEVLQAPMEPFSVVEAVEQHREYWKPVRTRTVLLAESHVFTTAGEHRPCRFPAGAVPDDLPNQFVRFVYCLAYGEKAFLPQGAEPMSGTPQFWKIFKACLGPATSPNYFDDVLATKSKTRERLAAKLGVLGQLRNRGIWLLDASVVALYSPGAEKPSPKMMKRTIEECWRTHTRCQVESAEPETLIVVGKGVCKTLAQELRHVTARVVSVPQPQARLSKSEIKETYRTYWEHCRP